MPKKLMKKARSPYKEPHGSPWYPPVDESPDVPTDDSFFVHAVVIATVIIAGLVVVFLKSIGIL